MTHDQPDQRHPDGLVFAATFAALKNTMLADHSIEPRAKIGEVMIWPAFANYAATDDSTNTYDSR